MFLHNFKYRLKYMRHDKIGLFWMLLFPFGMATFFFIAFSELGDVQVRSFPVAIVGENAQFTAIADSSGLFDITQADMEEAQTLLENADVRGIIDLDNDYKITVASDGIEESVLIYFMDIYLSTQEIYGDIAEANPDYFKDNFFAAFDYSKTYCTEKHINKNADTTVLYFYALIGMTTIMGGTMAIEPVASYQANQSDYAPRIVVSPINKLKGFFASAMATVTFHFFTSMLTLAYMILVLGIDFGDKIGWIILLCAAACFTGIMMGALVSAVIKRRESIKMAVILGYTLAGSTLAGMMATEISYYVDLYVPFLKYVNPVKLVTDGLYSLYYYDSLEKYFLRLAILIGMGAAACIGTGMILRRQQYASI